MTLILTCLTKDFLVQASDRRLTVERGKRYEVSTEESNKAIIYHHHCVFAYTGRSLLMGANAAEWGAQRLSEKGNLEEALKHLRDRATDMMKNYYGGPCRPEKRLEFIGAGFASLQEHGRWTLQPCRFVISNFRDEKGRYLDTSLKEFRLRVIPLPERKQFELFDAGQELSSERRSVLHNFIRRCLRNKKGPETIGRLLAREIQAVADTNGYVGKNIMCTFIPRTLRENLGIGIHMGGIVLETPVRSEEPQVLKPAHPISLHHRFAILPPFDGPRYVYIAGNEEALPYVSPISVFPGTVFPGITVEDIQITVPPFVQVLEFPPSEETRKESEKEDVDAET